MNVSIVPHFIGHYVLWKSTCPDVSCYINAFQVILCHKIKSLFAHTVFPNTDKEATKIVQWLIQEQRSRRWREHGLNRWAGAQVTTGGQWRQEDNRAWMYCRFYRCRCSVKSWGGKLISYKTLSASERRVTVSCPVLQRPPLIKPLNEQVTCIITRGHRLQRREPPTHGQEQPPRTVHWCVFGLFWVARLYSTRFFPFLFRSNPPWKC